MYCDPPDAPKPLLQFSGRDELVMPRASLKDTPNLGRKSTFKPLIAKSHREEAKTLLKALSVPALADTADPPVAVKSIDACLKLGPAASVSQSSRERLPIANNYLLDQRQLFNESQRILTDVQNIIKTDNPALPPESLLDTPDNKVGKALPRAEIS